MTPHYLHDPLIWEPFVFKLFIYIVVRICSLRICILNVNIAIIILGRRSVWSCPGNEEQAYEIMELWIGGEKCSKVNFEKPIMPCKRSPHSRSRE